MKLLILPKVKQTYTYEKAQEEIDRMTQVINEMESMRDAVMLLQCDLPHEVVDNSF